MYNIKTLLNPKDLQLIKSIKEISTANTEKYEHIQTLVTELVALMDDLDLQPCDIEMNGLNCIVPRDEVIESLEADMKNSLNDNEDPSNDVVQDLAFAYRNSDEYFYLNGYDRLELVTDADVLGITDDLIDVIQSDGLPD